MNFSIDNSRSIRETNLQSRLFLRTKTGREIGPLLTKNLYIRDTMEPRFIENRFFWMTAALTCCVGTCVCAGASEDQPLQLDPLQVVSTATRTERLVKELPIRTEIVSSNVFHSAGARDLGSAIEYLPGVRSEANCQNCGTAEIKMLGLGSGYNQLLFDGQPLFSGLASVYGIEQIPTAFIDRIEVIKGGASSIYGPGAVAGVINILPKEPVKSSGKYDASVESVDGSVFFSSSALYNWSNAESDLALSLYGQFNDNESIDLNGDGFSEITEKRFHTLGLNAWTYPTENGKLSYNYSYSWEKRRGGDRFDLVPHEAQIAEQLEHNWHRGGMHWEQGNGAGGVFKLGASFSYVDRHSYYGGIGDTPFPAHPGYNPEVHAQAIDYSRLLYGYSDTMRYYLDALHTQQFGEHYLSIGLQYQIDELFDEKRDERGNSLRSDGSLATFRGEDPIAKDNYSNGGIFLQDEWMPHSKLTVISGLRADKHSKLEKWIVSPRAAARFSANEDWTWRASVSTGFRAPKIFDEDFHIEILEDPTRTRNSPTLKEESSVSYSGGFVWIPSTLQSRLQAEVEIFSTTISDTFHVSDIVHTGALGNAYKERTNASGSSVSGIEANIGFRFSKRWRTDIGATLVDARFDDKQEVLPDIYEDRYLETPRWTGVAQLRYENEALFDFFIGAVYTGSMIAPKEVEGVLNRDTDDFIAIDLTFTKHMDLSIGARDIHFDIIAGLKNLLDERQKDLTSGPNRDTTYFYGPRFPRSVFAKATFAW